MPTHHRVPVTDDQSVAAVHHEADGGATADGTDWLVFCHGFRSDKSGSYETRCERAAAEGYDAVRFDFRGCGEADGTFRESRLSARIADLRAVADYFDVDAAVLFGSSFGGKVAFHVAAADDWPTAVATRAPVTYNRAFARYRRALDRDGEYRFDTGERIDEDFFADFDSYEFESVAENLDVPVAIVHGSDDESVPLRDSLDAVAALQTDVLLQTVADEGHLFSRAAEDRLRELVFDWLARL